MILSLLRVAGHAAPYAFIASLRVTLRLPRATLPNRINIGPNPLFKACHLPSPARFENRRNPCKHCLGTLARFISPSPAGGKVQGQRFRVQGSRWVFERPPLLLPSSFSILYFL